MHRVGVGAARMRRSTMERLPLAPRLPRTLQGGGGVQRMRVCVHACVYGSGKGRSIQMGRGEWMGSLTQKQPEYEAVEDGAVAIHAAESCCHEAYARQRDVALETPPQTPRRCLLESRFPSSERVVAALFELHDDVQQRHLAALGALVQLLEVSGQDPLVVLPLQRRHLHAQDALILGRKGALDLLDHTAK
eukprot:365860-Chlamydomonas_euryale.AAC.3